MIRNQTLSSNIFSNIAKVAFIRRDNAINWLKVNFFSPWSPLCPWAKYESRMYNLHKSFSLFVQVSPQWWKLNEHFQFRRLNYFTINLAEMFWRIYAIDAPHSVCQFIELVCSAHLFAIWVGKRVNQPNGIVSKTNEWKLCLLNVGLPCFFGFPLAMLFLVFIKRLMLAGVELCEDWLNLTEACTQDHNEPVKLYESSDRRGNN